MKQPIKVFYSYSHKNEELRKKLEDHLSTLRRNGEIEDWHDRKIVPGEYWDREISDKLNLADIILLLVSADFLASDYCYEKEMVRAVERHENEEAVVIPIILGSCDWKDTVFGQRNIQSLPKDTLPVTNWTNIDNAFLNIVEGIRSAIEKLRQRRTHDASGRRLDLSEYEKQIAREDIKEIKTANPYLLGDKFAGRKQEFQDLTNWLKDDVNRVFCIYNLGGAGKSALVWHWLNHNETRKALEGLEYKQFWCSFYARSFDSIQFLRDLATKLGGEPILPDDEFLAQSALVKFVLDRLRNDKWLLVLDGLEREMGAFKDPDYYLVDSEEQDLKNETGLIFYDDQRIRSHVFAWFITSLLGTPNKVLITSRIFPEELKSFDNPRRGVLSYPLLPMTSEDALEVWNISGEPDGSEFQKEFFRCVDFHPQVISVVSAAVRMQDLPFSEWFNEFSEEEKKFCLDLTSPLTTRRHRWLDIATHDLIHHHRAAWLTICYIVRQSEASDLESLTKALVKPITDELKPGRFSSENKLLETLEYLEKRRLIGIDFKLGLLDVHPVIRGQVVKYIMKQYEPGGNPDFEMMELIESSGDHKELMMRFLSQPDPEKRFGALRAILGDFEGNPVAQNTTLNLIGALYDQTLEGGRPWMSSLPALRLRKDQAYVLLRTGHELMTRAVWDESETVFNRAKIAYYLCGDLESVEECRQSHNWQALYGGDLMNSESYELDLIEKDKDNAYPMYWLALLLSIRQSEHARTLLESLPSDTSRWTLQTVAEAWYYLEEYEKSAALAREALDRHNRKEERDSVGQLLWETVTLGLSSVRSGNSDKAINYLDYAKQRGTGWSYNLVPKFALAGIVEHHYLESTKKRGVNDKRDHYSQADAAYKLYLKADPNDIFQIPASEAHLAMARIQRERYEIDDAIALAQRALKIARGNNPPFHYASVVNRAIDFLVEDLQQSVSDVPEKSFKASEHEERLEKWIKSRKEHDQ